MGFYIVRRLFQALIAIFGILTILFVMLHASGDPALILAGAQSDPQVIAALHHQLGLDAPLWEQYVTFLGGAVHLYFGDSYLFNQSALPVVLAALPASLILVVVAQVIAVILAFAVGTYAAVRGSSTSRWVMIAAFFGQAVPFFWLALILVLVFALQLRLLPPTGTVQTEGWAALVLPVASICVPNVATLSRLIRGQVLDVLAQPYVTTAISKGLAFRSVLFRHVLPNAIPPIISWLAIQFSFLLGATIILEPIFNYQGMGILMIQAVNGRDFSIVEAGVFLFSSFVIGANLLGDILNRVLDPRLRQAAR
jgi:ABC-type dipeptide/oligopeptide/nickel transport system permease component